MFNSKIGRIKIIQKYRACPTMHKHCAEKSENRNV